VTARVGRDPLPGATSQGPARRALDAIPAGDQEQTPTGRVTPVRHQPDRSTAATGPGAAPLIPASDRIDLDLSP